MNEYSIIGIIVALVGILKGKDVWDYLKSVNENKIKEHDKIILIYENQIIELKDKIIQLEKKIEDLIIRLEQKITKSRGNNKQQK
jgi:hypothetical protein